MKALTALAGVVLLAVIQAFSPLQVKAHELSDEGCSQVIVDYERACGAIVELRSVYRLEKPGSCAEILVSAKSRWNASGILFQQGVSYRIEVVDGENPIWNDKKIEATAEGWCKEPNSKCQRPDGFKGWIMRLMEPFRRSPEHDWFYLMGAVGDGKADKPEPFPIGLNRIVKPEVDGEFCSFANDLPFMYGNNSGSLKLKITRVSEEGDSVSRAK